jgi:hypothetical protein
VKTLPTFELRFHKIEALFDPLDPGIEAIHPAMDPRKPFFQMRNTHFQILNIVTDMIHALLNARKPRMNFLQNRNDDVRDLTHV